jgi:RNase H-fold protein (predicted Holliday junction resolvase)
VELYDERLSTFEARERVKTVSQRSRRRHDVDAVAAAIILESWLAAHRNER